MKKMYSTILLAVLMSMVEAKVFAHDIEVKNANGVTIYYNFINDATELEVTFCGNSFSSYSDEYTGSVVIPESVTYNGNTYSVTSIGESAFFYCSGLTELTIPNSVTSIGESAFAVCRGLTELTIPNSVTSIGSSAFSNCSGLTELTIGNSVTYIGIFAFYDCRGLTKVNISDLAAWCKIFFGSNPLTYAHHLYLNGEEIKDLLIPSSVTSIESSAFYGCSGLTELTIPNSVTFIGDRAFANCSGLDKIVVDIDNPHYDSREDCNAVIRKDGNELVVGCKNTLIPNSVTSIGSYAFYGCSGLTELTIGNSVTSIGSSAFYVCSGLTELTIGNSVTFISDRAFANCSGLDKIVVDIDNPHYDSREDCNAIIRKDGNELVLGCKNTLIPNSVTSIGESAFCGCSGLTELTIPNSVTSIGDYAFEGCSGLTELTIGNSVTSIGYWAFEGCSGLTELTIPNSVTSIGDYAFEGCSGLTELTIGSCVTSIGYGAFDCRALTSVISLNTTPPDISNFAFNWITEQNATLHVPAGCKEAYQQAEHWRNFYNIVDDAPTGICPITADKRGKTTIYTLDGKQLHTTNAADLPTGIYIINGKKVAVK